MLDEALGIAVLVAGFGLSALPMTNRANGPDLHAEADLPLMPVFEQAAAEYEIPVELLLVLGEMGSGFEDRGATPTLERGYGVMALRENAWGGDSLALAASLTGNSTTRNPRSRAMMLSSVSTSKPAESNGTWRTNSRVMTR